MGEIKISVIIPVYNVEDYLEECIDSILRQSFEEFELICVDDGSTDRSGEILENYVRKDSRVSVIHQQNKYAGVARNQGLDAARGKYVMFLDSDDFFHKDMLRELFVRAESCDAQIVICNASRYDDRTGRFENTGQYLKVGMLPEQEPFSSQDIGGKVLLITSPAPWNELYDRNFLIENDLRFQPIKRFNDAFFFVTAIVRAERIATVKKRLVYYRVGRNNNLQSGNDEDPLIIVTLMRDIHEYMEKLGIYEEIRVELVYFTVVMLMFQVRHMSTEAGFRQLIGYIKEDASAEFALDDTPGLPHGVRWQDYRHIMDTDMETLVAEQFSPAVTTPPVLDGRSPELTPEVSVIVTALEPERSERRCLDSVAAQLDDRMEVICVHGPAAGGTPELLREFAGRDRRIVSVGTETAGTAAARTVGLKYAAGSYVLFLDGEDMLKPGTLAILLEKAKTEKLDLLLFDTAVQALDDEETTLAKAGKLTDFYRRRGTYSGVISGQRLFVRQQHGGEFIAAATGAMFSRALLGCLDEIPGEEVLSVRAMVRAERCGYLDEQLYIRTVAGGRPASKKADDFRKSFEAYAGLLQVHDEGLGVLTDSTCWNIALRAGKMRKRAAKLYMKLDPGDRKKINFDHDRRTAAYYMIFRGEAEREIKADKDIRTRLEEKKKANRLLKKELDRSFYEKLRRFACRQLKR